MSIGGLSQARLDRMHDVMARHVENGDLPGIVTLVSRHGETHVDAIGVKKLGGAPMQRDTIFRISSLTKPIAAAAAMTLLEECVLRLDDPVDELLPELADRKVLKRLDGPIDETVPANRPINVRDLLTMCIGMGYIVADTSNYPIQKALNEQALLQGPPKPQSQPAPDEWLRRVGALPLMYQPGEKWMYDLSMDVMGVLIARAANKSLEELLRERIFGPLGMNDTSFSVPADKLDRFATSYTTNAETGALEVYDEAAGGQWSSSPAFQSAGGGLVSTIDDYLAFGQMMLNKGTYNNQRFLSRLSIEAMTTNQLAPEQKAGAAPFLEANRGWGLGVSVITQRDSIANVPGRFGWEGGLGSSWASDPKEDLVAILMTQSDWSSPAGPHIYNDFWTLTYGAIDD